MISPHFPQSGGGPAVGSDTARYDPARYNLDGGIWDGKIRPTTADIRPWFGLLTT